MMTQDEKEIIEATRFFASVNNIHFDDKTEGLVLNAMKEVKSRLVGHTPVTQIDMLSEVFNTARMKYPGSKLGIETEFKNFKSKHKDWKEVLPLLSDAIESQKKVKIILKQRDGFAPSWKGFSHWINKRCWEEETPIEDSQIKIQDPNKPVYGGSLAEKLRIQKERL